MNMIILWNKLIISVKIVPYAPANYGGWQCSFELFKRANNRYKAVSMFGVPWKG